MPRNGTDVTVEIIGIDAAQHVFKILNEQQKLKITRQIGLSALFIETDAKRRAPSDVGKLRSTIQTKIKKMGYEADIYSDALYAAAVEKGSRPHFPPLSALEGWARRHGMEGMEFIIARAISRRGTKAQPFLFPSLEAEKPLFITAMKKIVKGLERGA